MSADKLDLILEEIKSLSKKIDSLDQRVGNLESRFENLETKADAIQEMVASIAEDTTKIRINQDRQQTTMEKLALRSIEQEAELDRIKVNIS
jgi:chromosome segregation ATPase